MPLSNVLRTSFGFLFVLLVEISLWQKFSSVNLLFQGIDKSACSPSFLIGLISGEVSDTLISTADERLGGDGSCSFYSSWNSRSLSFSSSVVIGSESRSYTTKFFVSWIIMRSYGTFLFWFSSSERSLLSLMASAVFIFCLPGMSIFISYNSGSESVFFMRSSFDP